jgi:hypothetical protein
MISPPDIQVVNLDTVQVGDRLKLDGGELGLPIALKPPTNLGKTEEVGHETVSMPFPQHENLDLFRINFCNHSVSPRYSDFVVSSGAVPSSFINLFSLSLYTIPTINLRADSSAA